jgi:hypothetical protein
VASANGFEVLTEIETNLIFSLPRTSPRNFENRDERRWKNALRESWHPSFHPCEIPKVTFIENGLKRNDQVLSAPGGKFRQLESYHKLQLYQCYKRNKTPWKNLKVFVSAWSFREGLSVAEKTIEKLPVRAVPVLLARAEGATRLPLAWIVCAAVGRCT